MKKYSHKTRVLYLHAGAEMYGADKILLQLLTNLDKNQFEPLVLLPNDGPLVGKIQEIGVHVQILEYPILRRKFFTLTGIIKYIFSYLKYSVYLAKFVKKNKVKLVHVNTTAVLEGVFIRVFNRIPIVWHIHEIILKPSVVFKFTSFLISHFSNIAITVSEATRNRLLESHLIKPGKIKTVYNGIETSNVISSDPIGKNEKLRYEMGISESATVIGMVGRINSWKGQNDFLDAMEIVFEQESNTHAVLVGGVFKGEEYRLLALQKRIQESKYRERIHLVEFTSQISDFYSMFDIFTLPSINPDPLPTVVLEAMANGLPIVGYRHGGITEMVDEDSGILVSPNNISLLGNAINNLIANPHLQKKLGKHAQERQEEYFNLKNFIENIEKIYLNLL